MKMLQQLQMDDNNLPAPVSGSRRTVVVGVKLDPESRELLTWALVKVAQPGDSVIALHVLGNHDNLDQDDKCCLFSLVKSFDSVLGVYEGFCNLKQVDLKLKICRGSSVKKILVREAKTSAAAKVIVGSDCKQGKIKRSYSVAKYCAKKLPMDCWVLAVNNGRIVYQKDGSPAAAGALQGRELSAKRSKEMKKHRSNSLLNLFHRTSSKNQRVLSESNTSETENPSDEKGYFETLELALKKASLEDRGSADKQDCSICPAGSLQQDKSSKQSALKSTSNGNKDNSLAIVPVQRAEVSSSITMLIREFPESKPGWPLLRRAISFDRQTISRASLRRISVVQWALRLPSRHTSSKASSDRKHEDSNQKKDQCLKLGGESGALVLVGTGTVATPSSPESNLKSIPKELEDLHERYLATCRLFSCQELSSATSNFSAENLIGKGGSSQVYKGCLPDHKEIAVKILKPSEDVLKEFLLEIEIITTLHHKNIISLLGFCYEDSKLLLVYDLLSRGSVEENLHGNKKDAQAFGWNERYKVALGVAEALSYLHSGRDRSVIHRDVKSSNILLYDDFEPQLSDFGLAKWISTSPSQITCNDVVGTFGYMAPEYFMYGKVNEKIDVYSFGVVLLEILTGRKPISDKHPKGQESLVMWAKPILDSGKFTRLLDPNLASNYDHDQMERMVLAASLCIRRDPRFRPQMSLVSKLLQGDAEVTERARLQVSASEKSETLDDEGRPSPNIQSHLNLALLDVEDDSLSVSSVEQNVSLEDYLQGRWSRSSSFD